MKWVDRKCQIAGGLIAKVWDSPMFPPWAAMVTTSVGSLVWCGGNFADESAAKAAVAAWIGKTMAQLSNALAAGETYPDDGA